MSNILELFNIAGFHEESNRAREFVDERMIDYSRHVVESRAIPDMRDGFKPVQRIAMWTMFKDIGLNKKIKTIGLAGAMMAQGYYAHGDASASSAIQMMSGPYINNEPYFTGHGSFGTKVEPTAIGAPRYTSVSISDFSKQTILRDEELLNMVPTVDGDATICETFLPLLPTVLLQGVSGMAIGYSTDILPHSVKSLQQATIDVIRGKKISNIDPFWSAYDCIIEEDPYRDLSYWATGKVEIANTTTVIIRSITPMTNPEKVKTHLLKLQDQGRISYFVDETSDDIRITVKMPRSELKGKSEIDLARMFKLSGRVSERLVVIGTNGKVKIYDSHQDLISDWVDWRFQFYTKRFEHLKAKANDELGFLQDLIKCFDADLPSKLPSCKSRKDLTSLIESICGHKRDELASLPTYRWTDEYRKKAEQRIKELLAEIDDHDSYLTDELKRKKLFINEVKALC